MANFEEMGNSVIAGDKEKSAELTKQAIDEGVNPLDIINKGLISGMDVVGQRFKAGDMFVPEVLMSANAMKGRYGLSKTITGRRRYTFIRESTSWHSIR